jgi:hypothetical protein
MRWLFALILICISLPTTAHADTIVFKDGSKIDVTKAWEEGGEIKCVIAGVEIGYAKEEVQRVIKKSWSSVPRAKGENILIQQDASCYASGKSFGYCTTLSLYGQECPPQDQKAKLKPNKACLMVLPRHTVPLPYYRPSNNLLNLRAHHRVMIWVNNLEDVQP